MESTANNSMSPSRKTQFKQTITDEGRRRRGKMTMSIRKQKKEVLLKKKRVAGSHGNNNRIFDLKGILLSLDSSEDDIIRATQEIRRLSSSEDNLYIQEILNDGIISILVRNLKCGIYQTSTVIYESAWALTNIASTNAMDVVMAGAIKDLVDLLQHSEDIVREQSAWCLGNIAGEGPDMRDQVLYGSALRPLLSDVENPSNLSHLGTVVWTVSNLCRGKPSPPSTLTVGAILPLVSLLDRPITEEIIVDVLWALSYLSDGNEEKIEEVFSSGVTPKLIKLLEDNTIRYKKLIIRILGNFVSGSEHQTDGVLDSGLFSLLAGLMGSQSREVRKESCWLASNIACGNHEQITKLVKKKKVVQELVASAMHDRWDVRQEALWALVNICICGNPSHVLSLVQADGLGPLVMVLSLENVDVTLLIGALDAIKNVLELNDHHLLLFAEHDGIDYLEQLQEHPSNTVYEKVVALIEDYFGVAEEEDENLAPEKNENGGFAFGISDQAKIALNAFPKQQHRASVFGRVPSNQLP